MKRFFLIYFITLSFPVFSQVLPVSLIFEEKTTYCFLSIKKGSYQLLLDGKAMGILQSNDSIEISIEELQGRAKWGDSVHLNFTHLILDPMDSVSVFGISKKNSGFNSSYDDRLEIGVVLGEFHFVNRVEMEKYIAAVLSAEIGYNAQPEFLKAKAIICRTYGNSNRNRHLPDSNRVCSTVHCQVYKGLKGVTSQILRAVRATKGKILVDDANKPILAAFHSNCGGQTVNSEDGFSYALPYLRSIVDSFCLTQPNAKWEERISREAWKKYLVQEGLTDTIEFSSFNLQNENRINVYSYQGLNLPLKKIRVDKHFRSTWFSIQEEGDTLVFSGRGYGHGIGLCQEGAMNIAAHDYSYQTIINFYYRNIKIVSRLEP